MVQGILAGGPQACYRATEVTEDDPQSAARDVRRAGVSAADILVGLAASGNTPYTLEAVRCARSIGAVTVGISCNLSAELSRQVDVAIEVDTGPEVIAGSTRMKAGTAQKMIVNMISTGVMIRLGHVYSNLMVNVQLTNAKLKERGTRILQEVTGVSYASAAAALQDAGDVKTAILMLRKGCSPEEAREILASMSTLREALEET